MSTSGPGNTDESWTNLNLLIRTLERAGSTFDCIKGTLELLLKILGAYETLESTRNENRRIESELEIYFQQLCENCAQPARLRMTKGLISLCRDIKVELAHIHHHHHHHSRSHNETGARVDDSTKFLEHYQRIQALLQGLILNTDPDLWENLNQDTGLETNSSTRHDYAHTWATAQDSSMRPAEAQRLYNWIPNSPPGATCWVTVPNARRVDVSRAVSAKLDAAYKLGAIFVFSTESCDFSSIIPSIAYQLADYSTPFRIALSNSHPQASSWSPEAQFEELLAKPLVKVRAALPTDLTVAIDLIDGCGSARPIIDAILAQSEGLPIKFFVFSLPEPYHGVSDRLSIHEIEGQCIMEGVEGELKAALKPFNFSELQLTSFVQRAEALFMCAAAAAVGSTDNAIIS